MNPGWLVTSANVWKAYTCCRIDAGRPTFIQRTLGEFGAFFRSAFHAEGTARASGLLQGLDPRVKLLTILGLVVCVTGTHRWEILVGLCGLALLLAGVSRISLGPWLLRIWGCVFTFTGLMALPALLNLVTPGDPLWVLAKFEHPMTVGPWALPALITVTRQGLVTAGLLVLRVTTAVSWVTLLTLTTRWDRLLQALQALRVPKTFLMGLGLMHRYVHRLIRESEEMHVAMQSRLAQPPTIRTGQRLVAARVGALLRKSIGFSQEVYDAMRARGYTGEVRVLEAPALRPLDYAWLFGMLSLLAAVIRWSGR